ncbi:MAG: hypothetical protein OZ948_00015 [Deltaproteobacteria bacterium]|nr:hypothetical protein [Deltaproteobacteria bacterium]
MIARKVLPGVLAGLLVAGLAAPLAAAAQAASAAGAASAAPDASQDWASWIQTLDESAKKLRELRRIEGQLQDEVDKAISRRYPRGAEKERLLAALARAQADLAEAEQQHPELLEQARQAGVPQGLLQDYEDLGADTPASADDE